jgi:RND family efflux transporter MFP subunit
VYLSAYLLVLGFGYIEGKIMKVMTKQLLRIGITLLILTIAVVLGYMLWIRYMDSPWTRDGRVRADVVNIAADVSGLVSEVTVHDNQFVHRGDVLFKIDPEHYRFALQHAEAQVQQTKAMLVMKKGQASRRAAVDDQVISRESREDTDMIATSAKAEYEAVVSQRDQAKLNLERTIIRSPVDGWVSNLLVRPGDFAQIGAAKLALIDQHSFWVYGYFEENKLALMQIGDPAEIRLLGSSKSLQGHIESIARGITDRDK